MDIESNYEKVLKAMPGWKPTRTERHFGVPAIKKVADMGFLDAFKILQRLIKEGRMPNE